MRIYDITIPIQKSLAPWPGDTPYTFTWNMRMSDGAGINLGTIQMSVHTGTHADAPFHFLNRGATIDESDLDVYCGPAVVIDVAGRSVIHPEDLAGVDLAHTPRVLLKTGAWRDHARFPDDVPVISTDLPAFLQAREVRLLGVDVPSVDRLDSKDLPNHHALAECGIRILESLDLSEVSAGEYELLALPLRLVGADASPVRAVLRR